MEKRPMSVPPDPDPIRAPGFADRHIGPRLSDIDKMLAVIGASSLDDMIDAVVPPSIRCGETLDLPPARSEAEALGRARPTTPQRTRR